MAKPEFIGIATVQTLANQLHKDIQMSGSYFRPDVFTRLGIAVISGIQFQDTKNVMNRKGGTSRKKVIGGTSLQNAIGYIEERKLETTTSWNKYLDNDGNYRELAVVDSQGQFTYPMSETAIRAIGLTYGEDLFDCLFHGDSTLVDNPLNMYDGIITNIKKDIISGRISEANKNYVVLDTIDPVSTGKDDIAAWTTFQKFVDSWHASLRNQPLVKVWCTPKTKTAIVTAYSHAFEGMQTPDMAKDSYRFMNMENVELVAEASLGLGDMLIATVADNAEYGVDDLNDKSFVKVKEGTDNDLADIIFQIQSNQGTRVVNVNPSRFCMSDGTLTPVLLSGDYKTNTFSVSSNNTIWGTVTKTPDSTDYATGTSITLTATATEIGVFVKWSDGVTTASRTVITKGQPDGVMAIFAAK